jgi:hypothetical protein
MSLENMQRRNTNHGRVPIRSGNQWHSSHTKYLPRRQMTPDLINAYGLKKVLEAYSGMNITKDLRESWSKEMQEIDSIRYLSMDHLAVALIMIHIHGQKITPECFDENVDPSMAQFLDQLRLSSKNVDRTTIRKHKEVILIYIFTVLMFRQNNTFIHNTQVEKIEDPDEPEVQPPNMQHVTGTEDDYLPE